MRLVDSLKVGALSISVALLTNCEGPSGPEPDLSPPAVILHAAGEALVADADTVAVTGIASDDRGVEEISYQLNDLAEEFLAITPAKEVAFSFVVRDLTVGQHQLVVRARDQAGQTTEEQIPITVADDDAPIITIDQPLEETVTTADTSVVAGWAEDVHGVAKMSFRLNAGDETTVPVESALGRVPFGFIVRDLIVGENVIEVEAVDGSGNSALARRTITSRDVAAPRLGLAEPADGATTLADSVEVEAIAEDDRGLVGVTYRLNAGTSSEVRIAGQRRETVRFVVRGLREGPNELTVTAHDVGGNSTFTRVTINLSIPPFDPSQVHWVEIVEGLTRPLHLTAPPGDKRLFVVEQPGLVRIVEDGVLLPTPFLDISQHITAGGEEGLLGLAFHPNYAENGYFYLYHTDGNFDSRVARYRVSANPNVADAASRKEIILIDQPTDRPGHHKGGTLFFGRDGMLYIALGDGAAAVDYYGNAQNLGTLLGAILRIDVDRGDPYAIPSNNPFVGVPGARNEVWAIGLRNPWRISVDPVDGTIYVPDVGEDAWEEINVVPVGKSGLNFGWPIVEGGDCLFNQPNCDKSRFEPPVTMYSHDEGCSVIGGLVYRGDRFPALRGHYAYSDLCSAFLRSFRYRQGRASEARDWGVAPASGVTAIGADGNGEFYLLTIGGSIFRLEWRP